MLFEQSLARQASKKEKVSEDPKCVDCGRTLDESRRIDLVTSLPPGQADDVQDYCEDCWNGNRRQAAEGDEPQAKTEEGKGKEAPLPKKKKKEEKPISDEGTPLFVPEPSEEFGLGPYGQVPNDIPFPNELPEDEFDPADAAFLMFKRTLDRVKNSKKWTHMMTSNAEGVCENCGEESEHLRDGLCEYCARHEQERDVHYGDEPVKDGWEYWTHEAPPNDYWPE